MLNDLLIINALCQSKPVSINSWIKEDFEECSERLETVGVSDCCWDLGVVPSKRKPSEVLRKLTYARTVVIMTMRAKYDPEP